MDWVNQPCNNTRVPPEHSLFPLQHWPETQGMAGVFQMPAATWVQVWSQPMVCKTARGEESVSNPAVLTPCLRPARRWESAAPPGQTHPYLNHLRQIPSVSQLQDNVELIVFNERIQILDYVGVVQLLQREGMQEQQLQRGQGSPSSSCEPQWGTHSLGTLLQTNPGRNSISHRQHPGGVLGKEQFQPNRVKQPLLLQTHKTFKSNVLKDALLSNNQFFSH